MLDPISDLSEKLDNILHRVGSLITATLMVREHGSNLNAEGDLLGIARDILKGGHELISKMEGTNEKNTAENEAGRHRLSLQKKSACVGQTRGQDS